MKNISFKYSGLLLLAIIALAAFFASFERAENLIAPQAVYRTWTGGAISNAENDTLSIPQILESPYQYSIYFRFATSAGTRAGKIYLEQKNLTAQTNWMKVDSTSLAAGTFDYLMKGANTWGTMHRVIVDGSGTQTTTYTGTAVFKKTN